MKYSLISAKSEIFFTDYRNFYVLTNFALIFAQPFKFWGTGANFPGDPIGKALKWEESVKRTLYGLANTLDICKNVSQQTIISLEKTSVWPSQKLVGHFSYFFQN
jgi:hypothetical protein